MVNGTAILLFLNDYANSFSTLSVISYHFSIIHYPVIHYSIIHYPVIHYSIIPLLNSHHSPPQPAGLRNCNAAAFASLLKFAAPF
jgi:hypothetical protein